MPHTSDEKLVQEVDELLRDAKTEDPELNRVERAFDVEKRWMDAFLQALRQGKDALSAADVYSDLLDKFSDEDLILLLKNTEFFKDSHEQRRKLLLNAFLIRKLERFEKGKSNVV